jgi:hypothetical protein
MGLMKVFSSEILAMALKEKIEAIGIDVLMKTIFNQLDWQVLVVQDQQLFVQNRICKE